MELMLVHGGRLVLENGVTQGSLLVEKGVIRAVLPPGGSLPDASYCPRIDATGLYVAPGLIDIHVHGGGGSAFLDDPPLQMREC